MRKSLVSLVALGVFLGAPALADRAIAQTTTNQTATTQQQSSSLTSNQFEEMLADYEARSEIKAHIIRAITPEGVHVLALVGPRNLEANASPSAQDSDIRDRFEEGRFSDVVILGEPRIYRADLDEDHYIFALSADQMVRYGVQTGGLSSDTGTQSNSMTGQSGTQSSQTDTQTTTQSGTSGSAATGQTGTQSGSTVGQTTGTQSSSTTGQTTGTQSGSTVAQTDTQTNTQSGSTGTQTGTQTGSTIGQSDTQTNTQSGSTVGQTTGTQTGTQAGSTIGQSDTQSGTQGGSTTGQTTGSEAGSTLSQSGTQSGSTTMGQANSQSGSETGTKSGSTTMSQTDTQTGTQSGSGTQSSTSVSQTETGQAGRALSEPDAERIVTQLEEAGLEGAEEFQGRLVRAMSNGSPVFFIITSKDMDSGGSVDIAEDDLRSKLQGSDLEDIQFIDNAKIVRGNYKNDQIFVFAGDLFGENQQQ